MPDQEDDLPELPSDATVRRDAESEPYHDPEPPLDYACWPGIAIGCDYEIAQSPPPAGDEDDAGIAGVVRRFHSLTPEEFAASWREVATDPYYSFQSDGVVPVNGGLVKAWADSPALAAFLEGFPLASPRKVELQGLQILYVGNNRAVVTYRREEEGRDGQILAGNGAAIAVKVKDQGWRVTALVKDDRGPRAALP